MDALGAEAQAFTIVPGTAETGAPLFAVLLKRTYDIHQGRSATRSESVRPLLQTDVYYDDGDAESSTVKYESELFPYKLFTDVVVIGKAYAPGGGPVAEMSVGIEVSGRRKVIRVTGDRHCLFEGPRPPTFTEPAAFIEMEIRYDCAYGGSDHRSDPDRPFHYPRNPMGKGMAIKNTQEAIEGLALPNLEDPTDLLTPERVVLGEPERWNQQPLPQGFGWFQRTWYPRCSFVGAVPGFISPTEATREERLGLVRRGHIALARQFKLPSYDVRFGNGASLGLIFPHLSGGEPIRLAYLTRGGRLAFTLPEERPRLMLDIGRGETELEPVLQTVCIRPDEMQVDLIWRGAHEYPGVDWLPEMTRLRAEAI